MSNHQEFAAIMLSRSPEQINAALEGAGSTIRLTEKVANTLHFKDGATAFEITEQEFLATDKPVLGLLKERAAR